jgi:quinol monooxygenase YgiN
MTVTSVHVLRYDQGRTWSQMKEQRPASALYWHPGVQALSDSNGFPIPDEHEWMMLATWRDADAWRAAAKGPGPWRGAREAWSCLLEPGRTRYQPAEAAWADGGRVPPFGAPFSQEPAGPVAVLTTVSLEPQLETALRFQRDVEAVVASLPGTPGSLGYRLGAAEDFPQTVDAMTFSLWATWSDARRWAYRSGLHSRAMHEHGAGDHRARGSFTTFAVLAATGASTVIHPDLEPLLAHERTRDASHRPTALAAPSQAKGNA